MTHGHIGQDTRKRLSIMTETTDGFLISEADMKLRGPGDIEGTQQSGLAFNLKIASLTRDGQILGVARDAAQATLDAFPELTTTSLAALADAVASPTSEGGEPHATTLSLLLGELRRRFAKEVDWSRIS